MGVLSGEWFLEVKKMLRVYSYECNGVGLEKAKTSSEWFLAIFPKNILGVPYQRNPIIILGG